MKRLVSAVLSAFMLFTAFYAFPHARAASEYTFEYTNVDGKLILTGASGGGNVLNIPETIDGLPVSYINAGFMANNSEITAVTLPDSLESIGKRAFSRCINLSNVYVGSGTAYIANYAFSACPSLKRMSVSSENQVYHSVNGSMYSGDTLLLYAGEGNAELPPTTKAVGDRAFFGKTNIISVKIPESVTAIGDYAFSGCLSLREINIPDSVEKLGSYCFLSCTALEKANLSKNLKAVPNDCFNSCSALRYVSIPDSAESVGANAFYSCESLDGLYIPPSVADIGENAVGRKYSIRNSAEENIDGFTIYGKKGSAAEKYAASLGISFSEGEKMLLGDVTGDGLIDGKDASAILTEYAELSMGYAPSFSDLQRRAADFNSDGILDGKDASAVLSFYAEASASRS